MTTFLIALGVFALALLAMAVGVLFGRQPIKGSCGGLDKVKGLEASCPACGGSCKTPDDSGPTT